MTESGAALFKKLPVMWRDLVKKPATVWVLLVAAAVGTLFLWTGDHPDQENGRQTGLKTIVTDPVGNGENEEARLEMELTRTLEAVAGVGKVRVDLHLRTNNRKIWERQTQANKRVSQEQNAVNTEESNTDGLAMGKDRDGRDVPILKEDLAPEVEGVVIVAEGAQDGHLRELLTNTVMTILGLPAHRVMVIPGKPEKEGP